MVIRKGNTLALFGPNGSEKSILLMAIMGFPRYQIIKGNITFKGKDIINLPLALKGKETMRALTN